MNQCQPDENSAFRELAELRRQNAELKAVVDNMVAEQKQSLFFAKSAFPKFLSKLPDGIIVDVNEAFEREFGITKQEAVGKTAFELGINPDDEVKKQILEALNVSGSVHNQEMVLYSKSGEKRYYETNIEKVVIRGEEYLLNTTQNISEYKSAKRKLKESYDLIRIAGEKAKLGGWNIYLEENRIYWSDEVAAIHGMPAGYSPLVTEAINFFAPEWHDKITEILTLCVHEGLPFDEEIEIITSTGKRVWTRVIGEAIKDSNGKIFKIQGSFQDITFIKQAEKELKDSEARYRAIFESAGTATLFVDGDKTILMANTECLNATGYAPFELIGHKWTDYVAPESLEEMIKNHELRRNNPDLLVPRYEVKLLNKKGLKRDVVLNVNMIQGTDQSVVSMLDITELKNTEKELQKSEEKYRLLFANNPQPMWIYDLETLAFLEVNQAAIAHYGYTREEFLSMTLKDIRPLNDITTLLEDIKNTHLTLNPAGEWRHLKKNGEIINVEITSHSVLFNNRKARHVLINDITTRKFFETELLKLSRAIEQSPVSIIVTDLEGNIAYANPKALSITGYSKEELIGENPRILNSGEKSKSEYKKLWETISSGKEWFGEFHNKKKNGELYWESASISPIFNNRHEIINYVAVKEDITERKRIENDLIAAKERAEESDQLKSAFLANMSHEIRTPMNGILGFTNLLLEPDLSDDTKEKYIDIIHKSGERMLNTVNDIVEISKIEAGLVELRYEATDFNSRVEELVQFFIPEANRKGLKIILEKLLPVGNKNLFTDQNKLDSILTNLIKNAIKYTPDGTISIGCQIKEPAIEFYIRDTGIGIPKHRQRAIFNRFEQADIKDTRVFEGSGLGLAIVKSYVEMLGGQIWVESEEGKGSTFYFTLPVASSTEEKPTNDDKILSDNKNATSKTKELKILIAEDDAISRIYLSLLVKNICREILEVETGYSTVEICKSNPDIDLILMDIQMPGMSGYEATQKIREFNKDVIIIAQTAFALGGDREKSIAAGCNDYISKPINKTKLQELIHTYFE